MNSTNKIPFKIFLIVLFAGIIGIAGEMILKWNMDRIADSYNEIIGMHYVNRAYINRLSTALFAHQAKVANHVVADEDDVMERYENEVVAQEAEIENILSVMNDRMKGDKREQIFHKVYSAYYSYLQNVDIAFELSRERSTATAQLYVTTTLDDFISEMNYCLSNLEALTISEMNGAQERMISNQRTSRISQAVCISLIIVSLVITLFYCFRATSNLDHYKDELEAEVERQNADLQAHQEKLISIQNNTIIAMATLIENRDGDTGEHVMRTSAYVSMLAKEAKAQGYCENVLTDEYIELLTKAAPMHDIGKITVPDRILQKPGKLTPEEFESIKLHAVEGGRIIREVMENIEEQEYVEIAASVAAYHHEKWDGTGYSMLLKGEDIPLCARIMAIADVFDALISKRCYKEAMPLDEAFTIIKESAGSHFDPTLARIFLGLRPRIEAYLRA